MPALKENKKYTIEDIMALPENEHAELIDGQIYYQAAPSRKHQDISGELYATIHDYIKRNGGQCKVYHAPFAVLLNDDDSVYIEPDISVICDRNKLSDRGCEGAPDWIIEIVSPGSRRMDYMIKLFKYRTAGVQEYWIISSMERSVEIYYLVAGRYVLQDCYILQDDSEEDYYNADQVITLREFPNISLTLAEIFENRD